MQKILFLTVGGSHIPVLQSIEDHDADHVVFFATGIDEATNNRATASMSHVKGVGCVMRSKPGGPLDLPNIPTQANVQANRWVAYEVLADDLDESYRRIHAHMAHFRSAHPAVAKR